MPMPADAVHCTAPLRRLIVAKRKSDPYLEGHASWLKIRNREYSQWAGREELFERERGGRSGFPSLGWLRSGVQQRRDVIREDYQLADRGRRGLFTPPQAR